ncbi:MAG: alpha/beta hydrolase fold domain-containing protein [Treponema sp.]|nr:alpha/beta hydrolase fold domain-containing protein [Treponema sp.]
MNKADDRKSAIKKLKTLVYSSKQQVEDFRKNVDKKFIKAILPNHVECSEQEYANIQCDVLAPEIYSLHRIMIYIHGGSFVGGSRQAWRGFCASLAAATSCRIVVPDFRLAPAYAFPAAVEDLQAVFRNVFTEEQVACSLDSVDGKTQESPEVIIAADGSGASQAMALILSLRERYRSCIKQVILFSPWLSLSPNSSIIKNKKSRDEIISGEALRKSGDIYTYSGNLENPMVSPIFISEETLQKLPPIFIQMGEKEVLLEDAKTFQKLMTRAGSVCQLDVWPDMMFMFQMADEFLAESHLAIEKVGKLITFKREAADEQTLTRSPVLENSITVEA